MLAQRAAHRPETVVTNSSPPSIRSSSRGARSSSSVLDLACASGRPAPSRRGRCVSAHARDLRQVRDRDHLRALGEPLEHVGDRVRGDAADAGVDLVEDHRLAARDGGDRERDARELAAGGGLGDRPERQPGFGRIRKRASSRAGRAELALARARRGTRPSPMPTLAQLVRDRVGEPRRALGARGRESASASCSIACLGGRERRRGPRRPGRGRRPTSRELAERLLAPGEQRRRTSSAR